MNEFVKLHQLSPQDALTNLKSNREGLSSAEAHRRLQEFGKNTIDKAKREPLILHFLRGFTHFFALILWCGAAIAFLAEWYEPGGGMATLGWAILIVILINGFFSFWQEYKAEQAITALQKMIPHVVKVWRDGKLSQLPTADLVPGDIIAIEEGDEVPADCRLIDCAALRVNNATITGESWPQARNTLASDQDDLIRSKNVILAGTSIFAGHANAVVFHTGMNTEFGKIARLTQAAPTALSPLQKEIVRLSRIIAVIALSVGGLFFFIGRAAGVSLVEAAIFALGIIVALVPEGLLPEVTLSLATCSQRMAKRNALIRHLGSVETLGCATVICTDKTGTLTQNKMAVRSLYTTDSMISLLPNSNKIDELEKVVLERLRDILINCENIIQVERDRQLCSLGDPMEIALAQFGYSIDGNQSPPYKRIDEIPFEADRKRLSTLHECHDGLRLYTKGALEAILPICSRAYVGQEQVPLQPALSEKFLMAQDEMAKRGLRVLALCYREVEPDYKLDRLEQDLTLVALVGLEDPPRPEVPDAIRKCREAGIRIIMITGDHPNTAVAIARQIELIVGDPLVLGGSDLRRLSDTELQLLLDTPEIIFARAEADQKMRIVNALKRKGDIVAVTGDGVNDAPALRAAHIGVAMGMNGTDVAREAADMVLADDNFASIVDAIEEGRGVFSNIRKFLTYVLSSNVAELVPCLAFMLLRVPLPLSVIQILSIDLGTDLAPALALGAEVPDKGVMHKAPRSRREGLFDIGLLLRAYLFLGTMVSVASMGVYFAVLTGGGWHYGQLLAFQDPLYMRATTACLMGIMCMQAVNSSICRSERESLFTIGPLSNKLLLLGLCLQFGLMMFITYTAWGQTLFHTAALPLRFWLIMMPFMMAMIFIEEMRKLLIRRFLPLKKTKARWDRSGNVADNSQGKGLPLRQSS